MNKEQGKVASSEAQRLQRWLEPGDIHETAGPRQREHGIKVACGKQIAAGVTRHLRNQNIEKGNGRHIGKQQVP